MVVVVVSYELRVVDVLVDAKIKIVSLKKA